MQVSPCDNVNKLTILCIVFDITSINGVATEKDYHLKIKDSIFYEYGFTATAQDKSDDVTKQRIAPFLFF